MVKQALIVMLELEAKIREVVAVLLKHTEVELRVKAVQVL